MLFRDVDGVRHEPYELLTVDIEEQNQGAVMEELGRRKGRRWLVRYGTRLKITDERLDLARGLVENGAYVIEHYGAGDSYKVDLGLASYEKQAKAKSDGKAEP